MYIGGSVNGEVQKGKVLCIGLILIGALDESDQRIVFFDLNGQSREIIVRDANAKTTAAVRRKADHGNTNHIAATMPGTILDVQVQQGDEIEEGQLLLISEAMKMETTLKAPRKAVVK